MHSRSYVWSHLRLAKSHEYVREIIHFPEHLHPCRKVDHTSSCYQAGVTQNPKVNWYRLVLKQHSSARRFHRSSVLNYWWWWLCLKCHDVRNYDYNLRRRSLRCLAMRHSGKAKSKQSVNNSTVQSEWSWSYRYFLCRRNEMTCNRRNRSGGQREFKAFKQWDILMTSSGTEDPFLPQASVGCSFSDLSSVRVRGSRSARRLAIYIKVGQGSLTFGRIDVAPKGNPYACNIQ